MTETFEEKLARMPWYGRAGYHMFKGSKLTGLDLMRKFPENIALPLMKRARSDLCQVYGDFFMEYTFEINSQKPVRYTGGI